jgi:hypothetical protein
MMRDRRGGQSKPPVSGRQYRLNFDDGQDVDLVGSQFGQPASRRGQLLGFIGSA